MAVVTFTVGETFSSFASLQEKINKFKEENYCELYVRDSKTINNAARTLRKSFSSEIQFYSIKYACVHGGKKFKQRGAGIRETRFVQVLYDLLCFGVLLCA